MREEIQQYINYDSKHLHDVKVSFEDKIYPLSNAIAKAAKAEDPTNSGKMFGHQRRVGLNKATEGYELLKLKELEISKCQTFEDIMIITDKVMIKVDRLGPLWSYDTALRIGFHLRIYPTDVYMQAGVVKGYVKMFDKKPKGRKVAISDFPMLAELEAYEIENFLCVWSKTSQKAINC